MIGGVVPLSAVARPGAAEGEKVAGGFRVAECGSGWGWRTRGGGGGA